MTLKEKFDLLIPIEFGGMQDPLLSNCVEVAEDFTIGFVEWFTNEKSEYSIMYGNQEKRFATFTKEYTAKELLEIYKKEKGL